MSAPSRKKAFEEMATQKTTGVSAAEASSVAAKLGQIADEIDTPPAIRSQCVFLREELLHTAAPSAAAKREQVMPAVTTLAAANA